jgi:type III secretion protein T
MNSRSRRVDAVELTSLAAFLERAPVYLLACGLALSRMAGLVMITPVFTRTGLTGLLRSVVAFVLALPIVPMLVASLGGEHLTVLASIALLTKEAVVGLTIGLVFGVPFWAAEAAGEILDLQRGSREATLFDASGAEEMNITGTLFGLTMVALYFVSGGLSVTLRAVYDSYQLWPAMRFLPLFGAAAAENFLALLDSVVKLAVILVIPVIICLLLSDLLLALVARAASHFNIFALSLTVKSLVFSILLVIYCAFLIRYMGSDLATLLDAQVRLKILSAP